MSYQVDEESPVLGTRGQQHRPRPELHYKGRNIMNKGIEQEGLDRKMQDFSGEIDKPLRYVDFISDYLSDKRHYNENGSMTLWDTTTRAFCWMLSDAGVTISEITSALYGGEEDDIMVDPRLEQLRSKTGGVFPNSVPL